MVSRRNRPMNVYHRAAAEDALDGLMEDIQAMDLVIRQEILLRRGFELQQVSVLLDGTRSALFVHISDQSTEHFPLTMIYRDIVRVGAIQRMNNHIVMILFHDLPNVPGFGDNEDDSDYSESVTNTGTELRVGSSSRLNPPLEPTDLSSYLETWFPAISTTFRAVLRIEAENRARGSVSQLTESLPLSSSISAQIPSRNPENLTTSEEANLEPVGTTISHSLMEGISLSVEEAVTTEGVVPSPNLTNEVIGVLRDVALENSSENREDIDGLEEDELHILSDMATSSIHVERLRNFSQFGDPNIPSAAIGGFQLRDGVILSRGVVWTGLTRSQEGFLDRLNQHPFIEILDELGISNNSSISPLTCETVSNEPVVHVTTNSVVTYNIHTYDRHNRIQLPAFPIRSLDSNEKAYFFRGLIHHHETEVTEILCLRSVVPVITDFNADNQILCPQYFYGERPNNSVVGLPDLSGFSDHRISVNSDRVTSFTAIETLGQLICLFHKRKLLVQSNYIVDAQNKDFVDKLISNNVGFIRRLKGVMEMDFVQTNAPELDIFELRFTQMMREDELWNQQMGVREIMLRIAEARMEYQIPFEKLAIEYTGIEHVPLELRQVPYYGGIFKYQYRKGDKFHNLTGRLMTSLRTCHLQVKRKLYEATEIMDPNLQFNDIDRLMSEIIYSRVIRIGLSSQETIQREARISGRWLDLLLNNDHGLRRTGEVDEAFIKRLLLKHWCRASIRRKCEDSHRSRSFAQAMHIFILMGTSDLSNIQYAEGGFLDKQEILVLQMFTNDELEDKIFCYEYLQFPYTPHSFINHFFNIAMRSRILYQEFGDCTLLSTFNLPWSTSEEVAFPIFKLLLAVIKPFIVAPDLGLVHSIPEPITSLIGSCYTAINLENAIISTISVLRHQLLNGINCVNVYRLNHQMIYKLVVGYNSLTEKQSFSTREGELCNAQGQLIPQYNDALFYRMPFDDAYKSSLTRKLCLHPEKTITE